MFIIGGVLIFAGFYYLGRKKAIAGSNGYSSGDAQHSLPDDTGNP
jgi:hypothetical protein